MKAIISLGFILLLTITIIKFSYASNYWVKVYGTTWDDQAGWVQQTDDGGYLVVGSTQNDHYSDWDGWVLKLDNNGTISWIKSYGGVIGDGFTYIQPTSDGGYIVSGGAESFGNGWDMDIWVLKFDSDYNVIWQKTYGMSDNDCAISVQQTIDEGYILLNQVNQIWGSGELEIGLLKLDNNGEVLWQKTYGRGYFDYPASMQQTNDGGYVLVGTTYAFSGDDADAFVLKLDDNGNIIWQKTYGGVDGESGRYIQQTSDGGYILVGGTSSFGLGTVDAWVSKLDSNGNVIWQKTYGGNSYEAAYSIQQTSEGEYILLASTSSFGLGYEDIWLLGLDANGEILWQKTYGGGDWEHMRSIQQVSDGGYIIHGFTHSFDFGDDNNWDRNAIILKVDSNGEIPGCFMSGTSNAIVSDTTITPQNSNFTVQSVSFNTIDVIPDSPDITLETGVPCCYDNNDNDYDCIFQEEDNCPYISNPNQEDNDADTTGDACDDCTDTDGDGLGNPGFPNNICDVDNCPDVVNTNQEDLDIDGIGDACDDCPNDPDNDVDYDDICGDIDFCPNDDENDIDGDTVCGDVDNCQNDYNPLQEDTDGSGVGNVCNDTIDSDGDEWEINFDNCPDTPSQNQEDTYPPQGNGIGDACECEADFDCDGDVDGSDATTFKLYFGRDPMFYPCDEINPCRGDFDCDQDCDGTDAVLFKSDFGRNEFNNPCPACTVGDWCSY